MKKAVLSAVLCAAAIFTAAACGCGGNAKIKYQKYDASTVSFKDNSGKDLTDYDKSLYYLNEWKLGYETVGQTGDFFPDMADPVIVYDDGYYYAFGTRQCTVYQCFRSADLTTWERLDDAFVPEKGSWGTTGLYAPDIQKIGDKWYLYYTATQTYSDERNRCQLGVAVADNVYGPYVQFTGVNANGEDISLGEPSFRGMAKHQILDANVLQDGDKLYMYFSYDTKTPQSYESDYAMMSKDRYAAEIWGVELKDPVTWDLSTLTPLLTPGYKTYDAPKRTISWETWSYVEGPGYGILEGPQIFKRNGKYILTYSANLYSHDCYAVGYAVSDSPLSGFEKPDDGTHLKNMLLGVPSAPGTGLANYYKGFTKGTGHAGIFRTPSGEYMFAYHAHFNREKWSETPPDNYRALALDYIYFDKDGMPYTNGPTYSLQLKPEHISGYRNIAGEAKIRAEGANAQYLNDNYTNRTCREIMLDPKVRYEDIKEAEFKAGTRSIEIKFGKPVTVKALNIYNSCDYSLSVLSIDQIDFGNGKGIVNALFNQRYFSSVTEEYIFPHAAFNIELGEEIVTDKIVITITSGKAFALGEIEVAGKLN